MVFQRAFDCADEIKTTALKFRESHFFVDLRAAGGGRAVRQLFEVGDGLGRAYGAVLRRAIEIIFGTSGWGGVDQQNLNVDGAVTGCELKPFDAAANVEIVHM